MKQQVSLMGLELTTDRYPPITSQTRYRLRHVVICSQHHYICSLLCRIFKLFSLVFYSYTTIPLGVLYYCVACITVCSDGNITTQLIPRGVPATIFSWVGTSTKQYYKNNEHKTTPRRDCFNWSYKRCIDMFCDDIQYMIYCLYLILSLK